MKYQISISDIKTKTFVFEADDIECAERMYYNGDEPIQIIESEDRRLTGPTSYSEESV